MTGPFSHDLLDGDGIWSGIGAFVQEEQHHPQLKAQMRFGSVYTGTPNASNQQSCVCLCVPKNPVRP
jgi:hypothetical protein